MAKLEISTKRVAIDKANAQMVVVAAIAAFITVFCLVAASSLWSEKSYQSRVITAKEQAFKQLQTNVQSVHNLVSSYKQFVSSPTNAIAGNTKGTGDQDGDNATIVLDALPSQYDFPALTSSLEKILTQQNLKVDGITGSDDEVAQEANQSSPTPQPIAMPFSFTANGVNYNSVQSLLDALQRSIRPIQIDKLSLSGGANNLSVNISAHTYYQPEKDLKIGTKVVK